jgi:hypothetical protein
MNGALGGAAQRQGEATADQRLDLKALRLAVHGWWLGNPLVYEPGVADLCAVAYRLASAGAASGTLIVGGAHNTDDPPPGDSATYHDLLQAVLILRTAVSPALIGQAAATSIAEMAQAALGLSCAVQKQWNVIVRDVRPPRSQSRLCHISADERQGATFLGLRLALEPLWAAAQEGNQLAGSLLARGDWREVFLARTLHALDVRLQSLFMAGTDAG